MLQIRHELEVARSRLTKLQSELQGRCWAGINIIICSFSFIFIQMDI